MLDVTLWKAKLIKKREKSRSPTYEAEKGLGSAEFGEDEDENNEIFR